MKHSLTDDQLTVLTLAAMDKSMIPAGRWEAPVLTLAACGLLRPLDPFNYVITDAGRVALEEEENEFLRRVVIGAQ